MKKLMMIAFVVSLATACSKKGSSCEEIFEHTKAISPEAFRAQMDAKKERSIQKCEKMSDDAKKCAMDAKTWEDLTKCPRE